MESSCARNEHSRNFKGSRVDLVNSTASPAEGTSARGIDAPIKMLLKSRRPDSAPACVAGARDRTFAVMGFTPRVAPTVKQNFRRSKRTGLVMWHGHFEFSSRSGSFWPPPAQNVPRAAQKCPRPLTYMIKSSVRGHRELILIGFG